MFFRRNVKKDDVITPAYFTEQLLEKEQLINDAINKASGNCSAFVFFTDAHWDDNQKYSPLLIKHIIRHTTISDVIFGGDVITHRFDNPQLGIDLGKEFRFCFDSSGYNIYYLLGNHDNNSDSSPSETVKILSDEQVFNYLQDGMSACHYGAFFNFYFDRPESKTRIICLDTGRYCYSIVSERITETVRFLINVLKKVPSGWRILIISHLWFDLDYGVPRKPHMSNIIKTIVELLDNYNARQESVFKYNGKTIEYDFSNATSKIICCIGGHCHMDYLQYSEGGIPIIITTTDSKQTINGEIVEKGTIEEQAISVFVFDYANQVMKMFRIGRGEDKELQI